jgi:hypothetical protein
MTLIADGTLWNDEEDTDPEFCGELISHEELTELSRFVDELCETWLA